MGLQGGQGVLIAHSMVGESNTKTVKCQFLLENSRVLFRSSRFVLGQGGAHLASPIPFVQGLTQPIFVCAC